MSQELFELLVKKNVSKYHENSGQEVKYNHTSIEPFFETLCKRLARDHIQADSE